MELFEKIYDIIGDDSFNAFITLRPKEEVLKEAKELLERGIEPKPITVKDNIATKGIRTTAGSKILQAYVPVFDATTVRKLKEKGYVIIGKTNMDEFGMGTTGENSAYGPAKNPLDTSKVTGGSSSGAGAAARGYCLPGIGSDTGGSIRAPAAWCSVFSLKPTYGAVSRYGLIPYADSLEQISPIAPSVSQLVEIFEIISGKDPRDHTTVKKPDLKEFDVEKLRFVVPENALELVDPEVRNAFNSFIRKLKNVEYKKVKALEKALPAYYVIALAEASSNLARYDGIRYGLPEELLPEVTENFYDFIAEVRGKYFGWEVKRRIAMGATVLSAGYSEELYLRALKARKAVYEELNEIVRESVLIMPTMPVTPPSFGAKSSPKELFAMDVLTVPVNLAGLPAGNAPIADGIGIQVVAERWGEGKIVSFLRFAEEYYRVSCQKLEART
ncbi:glutamyl-tRNA(Gln) amidotransferase [Ignicoccus pacificus DSM 13166]|uniref:Glutamyl-tRNA(Gln) amidotransferase subunit A n=1 Tax=Ignicoccus pacificus DSM 13166 TaxID=940294 RepID=A0A977K9M9_9CREN|nr:glutamyl-tRNA(Gln) amidotransferase [Ignicoccus pacificus DSM 13166]